MIRNVNCTNFMSFQSLNISFDSCGLTQIDGDVVDENHADNNGVGKTAILDMILYGLYGHLRRADKVDEIVNSQSGRNCRVEVWCQTPYGNLNVVRHRKHNQFKNELHASLDGVTVTGTDNKEIQKQVERYVGMDAPTFMRSMIFDGSMSLARMNDGDAKDFLERLLGLDLSKWHSTSKEYQKSCQIKREEARQAAALAAQQHKTLCDQVASLEAQSDHWTLESEGRYGELVQSIQAHQFALSNEWQPAKEAADLDVENKRRTISEIQSEVQQFAQHVNQYSALRSAITSAEANVRIAEAALMQAEQNRDHFLREAETRSCMTCGQALPPDQIARLETQFEMAVSTKAQAVSDAKTALTQAEYRLNDANVPHDPPDRSAQLQQLQVNLNAAIMGQANVQREMTRIETTIENLQGELSRLSTNPFAEPLATAERNRDSALHNADHAEAQANWWDGHVEAAVACTQMFSREGLRSYVLDMLLPYLNERLHYYLGRLTDGAIMADFRTTTATGRERFNIVVTRKHGGTSYSSLSQGERARLDLAMTLAVLDHIQTKTATPIVFFDELFDALDATGVDRVMAVLREISQSCAVVLISHNPAIKMHVDNVIRLVKEDGVSSLVEEIN